MPVMNFRKSLEMKSEIENMINGSETTKIFFFMGNYLLRKTLRQKSH